MMTYCNDEFLFDLLALHLGNSKLLIQYGVILRGRWRHRVIRFSLYHHKDEADDISLCVFSKFHKIFQIYRGQAVFLHFQYLRIFLDIIGNVSQSSY